MVEKVEVPTTITYAQVNELRRLGEMIGKVFKAVLDASPPKGMSVATMMVFKDALEKGFQSVTASEGSGTLLSNLNVADRQIMSFCELFPPDEHPEYGTGVKASVDLVRKDYREPGVLALIPRLFLDSYAKLLKIHSGFPNDFSKHFGFDVDGWLKANPNPEKNRDALAMLCAIAITEKAIDDLEETGCLYPEEPASSDFAYGGSPQKP